MVDIRGFTTFVAPLLTVLALGQDRPTDRAESRSSSESVLILRDAQEFLHPRELYHSSRVELPISDGLTALRAGAEAHWGRQRFLDHLTTFVVPELRGASERDVRVTQFGTLLLNAPESLQARVQEHLDAVQARTPKDGLAWNRIEVEMLTIRIDDSEAMGLELDGEAGSVGGTKLIPEEEIGPWLHRLESLGGQALGEILERRSLVFTDGGEAKVDGMESVRYIADYEVRVGVRPYPPDHELVIPVIEDVTSGVALEADGWILGEDRVGLRFDARVRELVALRKFETEHGPIALPESLERRFAAEVILLEGQGALFTSPEEGPGGAIHGVLIRATPVLLRAAPDHPNERVPR